MACWIYLLNTVVDQLIIGVGALPVAVMSGPTPHIKHLNRWDPKLYYVNDLILRQDPEVCLDSQRVSGHHDDDDDDDDDDNPYAPHKQHVLNPYCRSSVNVEV